VRMIGGDVLRCRGGHYWVDYRRGTVTLESKGRLMIVHIPCLGGGLGW
jgi:hypothetical protein